MFVSQRLGFPTLAALVFFVTAPTSQAQPPNGYRLVWEDNFDGDRLDQAKWTPDTHLRRGHLNTTDAITVKDGILSITTYSEGGKHHTGFLSTKGKFETTYGYYEAKIRFRSSPGQWGAFWLHSPSIGRPIGDPAKAGTEIDIVEHRAKDQKGVDVRDLMAMNLHWDGYKPKIHQHAGHNTVAPPGTPSLQGQWHTYALLWTPAEYRFYLDGKEQWHTDKAVSQRSEFILLTCEIEDKSWAGNIPEGGYGSLMESQTHMDVDWVRVWQPAAVSPAADPAFPIKGSEDATPVVNTPSTGLWNLAKSKQEVHVFATLFTAQQVRDYLASDAGIDAAIAWCKQTAVTKVYLETFRDGYQADRETLVRARGRFREAGIAVSGCVTTTQIGKRSTGWGIIACYTDKATQERLQAIFEYTAGLFDEIMIDDFWFTDCTCHACDAARQARRVTVAPQTYPVNGDSWEDYRCELMVRLSRERILQAARRVNPKVKVIIKFPQWYDRFHERGYEVTRQTADFDRIWVGTETRDYRDKKWGGTPQYEAYFIMRWLGGVGGAKCGGGWYDPYGTTAETYIEQARQTILGGARESLLFCYGDLLRGTGPKNVEALRAAIPELLAVAEQVRSRVAVGIAAYRPPNSHPEKETRVFDFVGMMGLPLVPCHEFPVDAAAAFFSVHSLKDPALAAKLSKFIRSGKPVLLTDGLAQKLSGMADLHAANVRVLPVKGDPKALLELSQSDLDAIRALLLRPIGRRIEAPNRVAIYLFADGSEVIENFNDHAVTVDLDGKSGEIAPRGWVYYWR